MLNPNSLLLLLERVLGSGGRLEQACWQMLHAQAANFMSEHKEELDEIIRRNPLFAEDLHYYTEPIAAAAAEPYDDSNPVGETPINYVSMYQSKRSRQTHEHEHEDPIEDFDEHSDPIEVIESSSSASEL